MARSRLEEQQVAPGHAPHVDVHVHAKMRSGPPARARQRQRESNTSKSPRPVAWVGAWTRPKQAGAPD